jgi:hypothetical protein
LIVNVGPKPLYNFTNSPLVEYDYVVFNYDGVGGYGAAFSRGGEIVYVQDLGGETWWLNTVVKYEKGELCLIQDKLVEIRELVRKKRLSVN